VLRVALRPSPMRTPMMRTTPTGKRPGDIFGRSGHWCSAIGNLQMLSDLSCLRELQVVAHFQRSEKLIAINQGLRAPPPASRCAPG
jgi:hypothetical protein